MIGSYFLPSSPLLPAETVHEVPAFTTLLITIAHGLSGHPDGLPMEAVMIWATQTS
jgi:hypothetical protein